MANSSVLDLEAVDTLTHPPHYTRDLEEDRVENANKDKVDAFAGFLTASFVETLFVSGNVGDHVGQGSAHALGGEFYGGLIYNAGPSDRHIIKVTAYSRCSGSGGYTVLDVQMSSGMPTVKESLYSNEAYKPQLTSSAGLLVNESTVFAPGSSSWAAGKFLGVVVDQAPTTLGQDLTVQIHWMPSASYTAA